MTADRFTCGATHGSRLRETSKTPPISIEVVLVTIERKLALLRDLLTSSPARRV